VRGAGYSLLLALFAIGKACAEPVQLQYFDLPPFSFEHEGQPSGYALALALSITAGLDIVVHTELVPLRRLNFEAEKAPIIVAAIVRNEEREPLYLWIGKLCTDAYLMVSRAPAQPVNNLEEARHLKSIAVMAGAWNEIYLRRGGLTNLDPASSLQLEVRRLAEGHDDAWFASRNAAIHAWKEAGHDPAQLRFGAPIAPMAIWMAASRSVPDEMVKTLRARFAAKVHDGTVAAVTKCPN